MSIHLLHVGGKSFFNYVDLGYYCLMSQLKKTPAAEVYSIVQSRHTEIDIVFVGGMLTRHNKYYNFIVIDNRTKRVTVYEYKLNPSGNDSVSSLREAFGTNDPQTTLVYELTSEDIGSVAFYKTRITLTLANAIAPLTLDGNVSERSSSAINKITIGQLGSIEHHGKARMFRSLGSKKHDAQIKTRFKERLQDFGVTPQEKADWYMIIINIVSIVGAGIILYSFISN